MVYVLMAALIGYLAAAYLLGAYLVVRLSAGRRVGQVLGGAAARRHTRPITAPVQDPAPPPPSPNQALPLPPRRVAA